MHLHTLVKVNHFNKSNEIRHTVVKEGRNIDGDEWTFFQVPTGSNTWNRANNYIFNAWLMKNHRAISFDGMVNDSYSSHCSMYEYVHCVQLPCSYRYDIVQVYMFA